MFVPLPDLNLPCVTYLFIKAIKELMQEMDEYKEKELPPTERKKNPLGRPNKRFLGRTINSMMTHNKRQNDRNQQRCQRKLKEMDDKQRKRSLRNYSKRYSKSESSHDIISSDSGNEEQTCKRSKNLEKKKTKRHNRKQKSPSSSNTFSSTSSSGDTDSSRSSSSSTESKAKKRKKKIYKKPATKVESYEEVHCEEYCNDRNMSYYVDPNVSYAAMAYSQMNHLIQQQQLVQHQMVKEELEKWIEIPSDLTCHSSESSLHINLNSSSAEEDENGILTFNLVSSEDEARDVNRNSKHASKVVAEKSNKLVSHIENDINDDESLQSHISVESETYHNNEIYSLCSSDSEDVEIMVTNTDTVLDTETNVNERSETKDKESNVIIKKCIKNDIEITNACYKINQESKDLKEKNRIEKIKTIKASSANISIVDLTNE